MIISKEDQEVARKKVDIADAYDVFKSMKGTYVICFDIVNLTLLTASREQRATWQ